MGQGLAALEMSAQCSSAGTTNSRRDSANERGSGRSASAFKDRTISACIERSVFSIAQIVICRKSCASCCGSFAVTSSRGSEAKVSHSKAQCMLSSTELSLYLKARGALVATKKAFVTPGWSRSWHSAASSRAKVSKGGRDAASVSEPSHCKVNKKAADVCKTSTACLRLWYALPCLSMSAETRLKRRRSVSGVVENLPQRSALWKICSARA
mmetsp:Transcript_11419/g.38139  ORF Transcript_11419/g.38139 Transcript_11419/m.38139 type:complete len:212 (-) Transcript_11419:278-913(-)